MRRVQQTGQPVTVTSRGKPLVRIEPVVEEMPYATGYGSMRGTVELFVSEDELVSEEQKGDWGTLGEWSKARP